MNETEYEQYIAALQREIRILKQKLVRSNINRQLLQDTLETQSTALKVRNEELERSRELIKLSEAKYRDLAHHDILTSLPNRAYFDECLKRVLLDSISTNTYFALLYIDLDRFKNINDSYGHDVGDIVLSQTAERLLSCVQSKDTVARIGGDEFAVILTDLHEYDLVEHTGKAILDTMSMPFLIEQTTYQLGISIGISLYPIDDEDPEKLLQKADLAMYNVKKHGISNYLFYRDLEDVQEKL